jgi:hypothetical protein
MSKLSYLIETKERYRICDATGSFTISVIESSGGVHYGMETQGVMSPGSLSKCVDLLRELIQIDCYNSVVRAGEKKGSIKVAKKVTARLDKLLQQRDSFTPKAK